MSVLAGPGSGKTTALAGRIAYLSGERHVPATSILAVTFTTAAAAALRHRLASILGAGATQVDIATFHALGLRIVRHWGSELGFGYRVPAVYGRDDARAVLREVAAAFGLLLAPEGPAQRSDPWAVSASELARAVERFRLRCTHGGGSWDDDEFDEELLRPLSAAYEALLHERTAIDYASMLSLPLHLFDRQPRALRMVQDAYRFVMVDEFQDACHLQYAFVRRLVELHDNLVVVGDPNQSIYKWRGAEPNHLLGFTEAFPQARVVVLNQNYRSTGRLVGLSNAVAAPLSYRPDSWTDNPPGLPARVYSAADEADEARFVATEIGRLLRDRQIEHPGQAAVLLRTNAQARVIVLALRGAAIPYSVRAENELFARAELRDVIAYLRLAHSLPDGPALARIINTPPRRLGHIEKALRRAPVPVSALAEWAQKRGGPPARRAVEALLALVADLHGEVGGAPPAAALDLVLERTGYLAWLARRTDGQPRLDSLDRLRTLMAASPAPELGTWLADLHLGEAEPLIDGRSNAVAVATIHSSKGQEWPVVFLPGVEEGLLPHGRTARPDGDLATDDEERRLVYVAVSRPQVLLYLTYCRTRRLADGEAGRAENRRPSRYLRTLPPDVVEHAA